MSEQVDLCDVENATPSRSQPPRIGKRTLFTNDIFRRVGDVVVSCPVLLKGILLPKVSAALREKLFLAVSAINDCRLCKWGHTHWAMARGVPLEEVNQILGLQNETLAANHPSEAAAILFAQHYAEQRGKIDPESIENLRKYYSKVEVAEILAYVRFMMLTNLTGNTVDAFLTGARGQSKGNFIESVISAVASPVTLLLTHLAKFNSQVGREEMRSGPRTAAPPNSDTRRASGGKSN